MSPPPHDDPPLGGRRSSDRSELELPSDTPVPILRAFWRLEGRTRDLQLGLGELRDLVHDLEGTLEAMSKADEIGAAVATALREDRAQRYTLGKKLLGGLAAALLVIPAVHDAVGWLVGS